MGALVLLGSKQFCLVDDVCWVVAGKNAGFWMSFLLVIYMDIYSLGVHEHVCGMKL